MMAQKPALRWPDSRVLDLLDIAVPVVQAPMAGISTPEMAIAVAQAGALGSLPLGMAGPDEARAAVDALGASARQLSLNFFCHSPAPTDPAAVRTWERVLAPFFAEAGLPAPPPFAAPPHTGFGAWQCDLVERLRPKAVSFHFGLPPRPLLDRVRATGVKVLCSATTVREALWLEGAGCDAVIAQGTEAGGHRGSFLGEEADAQAPTVTLVERLSRELRVPIIAAGGIGDARGIAAALRAGASAVQLGTAYLFCPEARLSPTVRAALDAAGEGSTTITTVLSGRPARALRTRIVDELGPAARAMPPFPLAALMSRPLAQASDRVGRTDFAAIWCGEGVGLGVREPAAAMTRRLAEEASALMSI